MPLNCQPATKARTTPVAFFASGFPWSKGQFPNVADRQPFRRSAQVRIHAAIKGILVGVHYCFLPGKRGHQLIPRREAFLEPRLQGVKARVPFVCSHIDALIETVTSAVRLARRQCSWAWKRGVDFMGAEQMPAETADPSDFSAPCRTQLPLQGYVVSILGRDFVVEGPSKDHLTRRHRKNAIAWNLHVLDGRRSLRQRENPGVVRR